MVCLPQTLSLRGDPIVVTFGQQFARVLGDRAFELRRVDTKPLELGHVEFHGGRIVPRDPVAVGDDPRRAAGQRWKRSRQPVEIAAKVRQRALFGIVGPECERDAMARNDFAAMEQQIGQKRKRPRPAGQLEFGIVF